MHLNGLRPLDRKMLRRPFLFDRGQTRAGLDIGFLTDSLIFGLSVTFLSPEKIHSITRILVQAIRLRHGGWELHQSNVTAITVCSIGTFCWSISISVPKWRVGVLTDEVTCNPSVIVLSLADKTV